MLAVFNSIHIKTHKKALDACDAARTWESCFMRSSDACYCILYALVKVFSVQMVPFLYPNERKCIERLTSIFFFQIQYTYKYGYD